MPLEALASIKGAEASTSINALFEVIKNSPVHTGLSDLASIETEITLDSLREDVVVRASEEEKNRIKQNFPQEKNGYLVVAKVIED